MIRALVGYQRRHGQYAVILQCITNQERTMLLGPLVKAPILHCNNELLLQQHFDRCKYKNDIRSYTVWRHTGILIHYG